MDIRACLPGWEVLGNAGPAPSRRGSSPPLVFWGA